MREKIILAPGANSGEIIKSLSMHGINCINLRITNVGELARIALMRSGIAITEDYLNFREETAVIAEAVKGEGYLKNPTYSDIREITVAIRRIRTLVPDGIEDGKIEEKLGKGQFKEKNTALVSVYKKYMKIIRARKLMDLISLVRKALAEAETIDADFFSLKEYPLNPLENALLEKLSDGNIEGISLAQLYNIEDFSLKINSIKNCYGAANEVESILTDIYSSKNLDKCTVSVTDPATYGQLFFDYALLYDIPITFGCGIPIINSNPAQLLVLYYRWMTGGFFGATDINTMLSSKAFDRKKLYELYPEADANFSWGTYTDVLGDIRLTNDRATNDKRIADLKKAIAEEETLVDPRDEKAHKNLNRKKLCIPYLEVLAKELSLSAEDFISKYAYIRRGSEANSQKLLMKLDIAASRVIYEELRTIRKAGIVQSSEDLILNVLKKSVAESMSEEGKLYVTGIDGALSSVRENLYIAGLSSSNYPGSPRENYLLLDDDLMLFGHNADHMTSNGRIQLKQDRLHALTRLAAGLGSEINASFAGLNVSELKRDNASSLVFELYHEASGRNVTSKELEKYITRVDYFEPAISATRQIGAAYSDGKTINPQLPKEKKSTSSMKLSLEKEFSPSELDIFFKCPRCFMLNNVLDIPRPDDENPFEVIAANEIGNVAHALMEQLSNSDMELEDFLGLSGKYFDRFIAEHPPLVRQSAVAERKRFISMMEIAYNMDPHREVVLKEEEVCCKHESGVIIHGILDRVEKLGDDTFMVVDFKTGHTIKHKKDDIDTCLQIVIYAYLMEQQGFKISGGEFRYFRLGETISCKYDDEMKQNLFDRLTAFRNHMEAMDFPIPDNAYKEKRKEGDTDPCQYCKYGKICGKEAEMGGLEDE